MDYSELVDRVGRMHSEMTGAFGDERVRTSVSVGDATVELLAIPYQEDDLRDMSSGDDPAPAPTVTLHSIYDNGAHRLFHSITSISEEHCLVNGGGRVPARRVMGKYRNGGREQMAVGLVTETAAEITLAARKVFGAGWDCEGAEPRLDAPTVTLYQRASGEENRFYSITNIETNKSGTWVTGLQADGVTYIVCFADSPARITELARDEKAFGSTWSCKGGEPPVVVLPFFDEGPELWREVHSIVAEQSDFTGPTCWLTGIDADGAEARVRCSLSEEELCAACAAAGVPCPEAEGLPKEAQSALDETRRAVASRDHLPIVFCPRCGTPQKGKWFGEDTRFDEEWTMLQCADCGLLFKCLAKRTEYMTKDPHADWPECLCDGKGVPCPAEEPKPELLVGVDPGAEGRDKSVRMTLEQGIDGEWYIVDPMIAKVRTLRERVAELELSLAAAEDGWSYEMAEAKKARERVAELEEELLTSAGTHAEKRAIIQHKLTAALSNCSAARQGLNAALRQHDAYVLQAADEKEALEAESRNRADAESADWIRVRNQRDGLTVHVRELRQKRDALQEKLDAGNLRETESCPWCFGSGTRMSFRTRRPCRIRCIRCGGTGLVVVKPEQDKPEEPGKYLRDSRNPVEEPPCAPENNSSQGPPVDAGDDSEG